METCQESRRVDLSLFSISNSMAQRGCRTILRKTLLWGSFDQFAVGGIYRREVKDQGKRLRVTEKRAAPLEAILENQDEPHAELGEF
jgi:hypothetical protein